MDTAVQVDYYDLRSEGHFSVASLGYTTSMANLRQFLGKDNNAAVIPDAKGGLTNKVVLSKEFFESSKQDQNVTLVHETLHVGTQLGDVELAKKLGLGNLSQPDASRSIKDWLRSDCEKK